eukprot:GHVP01053894.1.p1 GENE.GHVP01053894.1~~GHVP01053894.1.p1  ORF type:complete len:209 (+),score=31.17 GHVP01053894.1:195-821(+)
MKSLLDRFLQRKVSTWIEISMPGALIASLALPVFQNPDKDSFLNFAVFYEISPLIPYVFASIFVLYGLAKFIIKKQKQRLKFGKVAFLVLLAVRLLKCGIFLVEIIRGIIRILTSTKMMETCNTLMAEQIGILVQFLSHLYCDLPLGWLSPLILIILWSLLNLFFLECCRAQWKLLSVGNSGILFLDGTPACIKEDAKKIAKWRLIQI